MTDRFLQEENDHLRKRSSAMTEAVWMVNTTGLQDWQDKEIQAESQYRLYCSDPKRFAVLKDKMAFAPEGSIERRQYERLYQSALENQLPTETLEEMVTLSSKLSNIFNTFRATVDGEKWTENQVRQILLTSTDVALREKVWQASKVIGQEVASGLLELIRVRNQAAQSLGFEDFHQMSFELQELDRDEVFTIFDDLKQLTDGPFQVMKDEMDDELRSQYGLSSDARLQPWHYKDPFFQEAPVVPGVDVSPFLKGRNIEKLTVDTFTSMGMEIRDMLAKSDLYEREGKNQHAFCLDMDREGDVRVLCNIRDNQYWMETMLHEYGHAVYDKYIDRNIPFLLRTPAHIFTTEAVAMFFGRLVKNREWLLQIAQVDRDEIDKILLGLEKMQQRQMLITARWVITFVRFERELYRDPDQDLNQLWWEIVKKVQFVEPPNRVDEPHWASKIHFTIAPAYYQNYLLGELTASQFDQYIKQHVSPTYFNQEVGNWFLKEIFFPGDRDGWSKLIENATGETLNPAHFVTQFVK
ncbi:peptidyl-dipeptidase A [Thermoactinomyces sp. DSM 45891]|uniref:M2 family metallopeptidase n=1 Tax=Thermoactinomyces sp. DSM 45891 TaxID=1761907 RepID=UPI00091A7DB3|nr:M2 family metallopeptidase [Thermoactinomyces sp. DSM 45891]SFX69599.1 peptidyl-dipeptidase A [Thermoactinomyces sp. DSM 45891]